MRTTSRGALHQFMLTLGPGILFAGAAIGGSHLVQSTRAGADYGFALLWAIVLVNLFKYPFFEFVQRYTAASGESFLMGYRRMSKGWLALYLGISLISGVLNIAALTVITAGLAGNLIGIDTVLGIELTVFRLSAVIVCVCVVLLLVGHYAAFDKFVKGLVLTLSISTLIAVSVAAAGAEAPAVPTERELWNLAGVTFLLSLMGWMPAPIDIGAFQSLWTMERAKETGYRPTVRQTLLDFHIGYIGTAVLALVFLALGALVMHPTGERFADSGIAFSAQFCTLYAETLGGWTYYIVAVAALSCIFSSTLTCFDGYTRVVHESVQLLRDLPEARAAREDWFYWAVMIFWGACTLLIAGLFLDSMIQLLTVVTVIAFLTAPLLAAMNYLVVRSPFMPERYRPAGWLHVLAWVGLVFLGGFAAFWLALTLNAWFG